MLYMSAQLKWQADDERNSGWAMSPRQRCNDLMDSADFVGRGLTEYFGFLNLGGTGTCVGFSKTFLS